MKEALISIIVAIYNVEAYVDQCIQSLVKQSYENLEIILVDDGSTDASGQICDDWKKKDHRVKVIHQKNQGLSAARNAGLFVASGEYIGFVDGDDYVHFQMYESMILALQKNKVELAICREKAFEENEVLKDGVLENIRCAVQTKKQLLNHFLDDFAGPINWAWNKLYTKELIGSKRFVTGKKLEDIVFSTDIILETENAVCLEERLYYYRQRSESIMGKRQPDMLLNYGEAIVYQYGRLKQAADMVDQKKNTVQCLKRLGMLEMEAYFTKEKIVRKKLREFFLNVYKDSIATVENRRERFVLGLIRYIPGLYYLRKRQR